MVAEGREKYLLWEAVPFFWFETGKRLGLINLAEGEWDQYLKICGEMAEGEERRETRKRRPMSSGTDPSPDSVAKRTEMLAGKMAAYDYLILKKTQHA